MRISEIHHTANVAWSPVNHTVTMLACGTSASQVDATFSTAATLDILEIGVGSDSLDAPVRGSIACDQRIYKLVWSPISQVGSQASSAGVLVAGVENGIVAYSADAILKRDSGNAVIKQISCHTGAVHALDISPLLPNLMASGAMESEVLIWDLNTLQEGISAGPKSFPIDEVNAVSWNRKINYIFASAYSTRCVLWDLRKHDSIIKLGDQNSRVRYKSLDWNPEIATQLALASEDDHTPVVQIWDLRNASSAVKTLEGHQRGILSVAWCPHDADLLLSTGKDGCVYCWDVSEGSKGEIVYSLPQTKQWTFEVGWCPRIPSVFSASSSNAVGVYSVIGGPDGHAAAPVTPSKLADSFPGMDFGPLTTGMKADSGFEGIKKAPKWLRRPGSFAFSFDGKIMKSFSDENISILELDRLTTSRHIVQQGSILEQYLMQNQHKEYCDAKISSVKNHQEREEWKFIKSLLESDHRQTVLSLLGYGPEKESLLNDTESSMSNGEKPSDVNLKESPGSEILKKPVGSTFKISTGKDTNGKITRALLTGNVQKAASLCLEHDREAEAVMLSLVGSTSFLPELFWNIHEKYFASHGSDLSSLVYALVKKDSEFLLQKARIDSWREIIAALINYLPKEEFQTFADALGQRLETEVNGLLLKQSILCYLCSGNIDKAVELWLRQEPLSAGTAAELLHTTAEKVLIASGGFSLNGTRPFGPHIDKLFHDYANYLASEGEAGLALRFLSRDSSSTLLPLKHHLYMALGPRAALRETGMKQSPMSTAIMSLRRHTKSGGTVLSNTAPNKYGPGPAAPFASTGYPTAAPNFMNPSVVGVSYTSPPSAMGTMNPPAGNTHEQQSAWNLYDHTHRSAVPEPPRPSRPQATPAPPLFAPAAGMPPLLPANSGLHSFPTQSYFSPSQAQNYPGTLPQQVQPGLENVPLMPSYQHVKAPGSWNDPPPLLSRRVSQTPASAAVNPIFQPLPVVPGQEVPPIPQYSSQPNAPVPITGYGIRPTTNLIHPPPAAMTTSETPFIPAEPEKEVSTEKAPIPAEHVPIADGFAQLWNISREKASSMGDGHTVRKLDDVYKKLELLNDSFRAGKLSSNTLMGLHQMVQCIQMGDLGQAVAVHAHIATGASFVEISSFMPALKILLQLAQRFNADLFIMDSHLQPSEHSVTGTWVRFEDPDRNRTPGLTDNGAVDASGVQINLPRPPRKSDYPPPDVVNLATSALPTESTSRTVQELQDVSRVQQILDFNAASDNIHLSPDTTIQIDEAENGKVLTTLKATNEKWEWVTPPVYHPEMVPQKVVNVLQIPLEDYVMCLDVLVTNYRFRTYVILYKRVIGIWLFITLVVLLALLFSGLRGLSLFVAGLLWLIFSGLGMCLCLYGKKKMNDGLRTVVANANKFLNKQRLMIGVEDRGKLSMHKVVVVILHYDVLPCLASIAHLLEQLKLSRPSIYDPTYSRDFGEPDALPMDKAEKLMLHCVQPYVKELVRKRLMFSNTKVEDFGFEDVTARPEVVEGVPTTPKHCPRSWCLCQYVDHMYLRRKPRKWYQKVWNED
ncbi:protein transport protein Sec31A-like [Paramacrobiotus metropolitanus]|uniref:protein transport protein Sec31A-like n=1 Tax=Paramacrobiotus metropolitanus TaxID=2943436 RepID=UPI0024455FC9|nr:protein transport protein Sec31A-like [Paramacrobiotus metropolitanus]